MSRHSWKRVLQRHFARSCQSLNKKSSVEQKTSRSHWYLNKFGRKHNGVSTIQCTFDGLVPPTDEHSSLIINAHLLKKEQINISQYDWIRIKHHRDDINRAMASQITGITIICPTVCSGTDQRKHQISASLAFVRATNAEMLPFDGVLMNNCSLSFSWQPQLLGQPLYDWLGYNWNQVH